ncbi:MAG: hypothetical protein RIQ78_611 [Bacteroidota bacterium]|jgi:hypothetical protein
MPDYDWIVHVKKIAVFGLPPYDHLNWCQDA